MRTFVLTASSLLGSIALLYAQARAPQTAPPPPPPPPAAPPIYAAPRYPVVNPTVYVYNQRPIPIQTASAASAAPAAPTYLIPPEQAQGIINRFKDQYKKLDSPRVAIYVNRDLVDLVSTNANRLRDRKETPLADRQTVRDVERLFARPLRMAGVEVVDYGVARQLVSGSAVQGDSEREALSKVADVVLEILIASKETRIMEADGERTYSVPDIQATAIRLKDWRILGQATASDLIGQGPAAGQAVKNFGVREIAEATALSLMEDIML